jgi:hypothetical protein
MQLRTGKVSRGPAVTISPSLLEEQHQRTYNNYIEEKYKEIKADHDILEARKEKEAMEKRTKDMRTLLEENGKNKEAARRRAEAAEREAKEAKARRIERKEERTVRREERTAARAEATRTERQGGGFRHKKPSVSQSKEILGKQRRIYKVAGSRKEHVKYKGQIIPVSDYKKLMKLKR